MWFYDRGYYWYSVVINLDTILDRRLCLDAEERWRRCQFLLSAAAGIRGAQNLPDLVVPKETKIVRPEIGLSLASLKNARGNLSKANSLFEQTEALLESFPSHIKQRLQPARLRRLAQISRSARIAANAVNAAESEYSRNTALVFEGMISLDNAELTSAEKVLGALAVVEGRMSWLYEAERCFMLALYKILDNSERVEDIYGLLCKAQYLYVLLGLTFAISPKLQAPRFKDVERSWDWTPSDVLRVPLLAGSRWQELDEKECTNLRKSCLGRNPLYEELAGPLQGDPPGRVRKGKTVHAVLRS
jgi:hypothetical protein